MMLEMKVVTFCAWAMTVLVVSDHGEPLHHMNLFRNTCAFESVLSCPNDGTVRCQR